MRDQMIWGKEEATPPLVHSASRSIPTQRCIARFPSFSIAFRKIAPVGPLQCTYSTHLPLVIHPLQVPLDLLADMYVLFGPISSEGCSSSPTGLPRSAYTRTSSAPSNSGRNVSDIFSVWVVLLEFVSYWTQRMYAWRDLSFEISGPLH